MGLGRVLPPRQGYSPAPELCARRAGGVGRHETWPGFTAAAGLKPCTPDCAPCAQGRRETWDLAGFYRRGTEGATARRSGIAFLFVGRSRPPLGDRPRGWRRRRRSRCWLDTPTFHGKRLVRKNFFITQTSPVRRFQAKDGGCYFDFQLSPFPDRSG